MSTPDPSRASGSSSSWLEPVRTEQQLAVGGFSAEASTLTQVRTDARGMDRKALCGLLVASLIVGAIGATACSSDSSTHGADCHAARDDYQAQIARVAKPDSLARSAWYKSLSKTKRAYVDAQTRALWDAADRACKTGLYS